MLRFKVALFSAIVGFTGVAAAVFGFKFCFKLVQPYVFPNWHWVHAFLAIFFAAGCHYLVNLAARPAKFIFKSSLIWSNVTGEKSLLVSMRTVTCNWKETFGVFAVDNAVRGVIGKIYDFAFSKQESIPEVLKKLADYKLFKHAHALLKETCDWADECVLAYCYKNSDSFLKECLSGIALFFKHSLSLTMMTFTMIVLRTICTITVYLLVILFYKSRSGLSVSVVLAVLIVGGFIVNCILSPIFDVFLCDKVVGAYLKALEKNSECDVDGFRQQMSSYVDFGPFDKVVRRLSSGNTAGDLGNDESEAEESGMDSGEQ